MKPQSVGCHLLISFMEAGSGQEPKIVEAMCPKDTAPWTLTAVSWLLIELWWQLRTLQWSHVMKSHMKIEANSRVQQGEQGLAQSCECCEEKLGTPSLRPVSLIIKPFSTGFTRLLFHFLFCLTVILILCMSYLLWWQRCNNWSSLLTLPVEGSTGLVKYAFPRRKQQHNNNWFQQLLFGSN